MVRERRADLLRCAGRRRRHPLGGARPAVRRGGAALCRLRRLSRAGAGRAHRRSRARTRQPVVGRPGRAFRALFRLARAPAEFVGWTELDTWNREDWTDRATIAQALAAFEGWHSQIRRIIAAADTCFIWALFDRDPLARWSVGRTTLLGDACHPMYPFMGQGAAQAIEDGAALAACLVAAGDGDPGGDPSGRSSATKSCACRASPGCRNSRAPTRPASTCPTARRSRRATPNGPGPATARPTPCAGSTRTTPEHPRRRERRARAHGVRPRKCSSTSRSSRMLLLLRPAA